MISGRINPDLFLKEEYGKEVVLENECLWWATVDSNAHVVF